MNIIDLSKEQLLNLKPADVDHIFTPEEIYHIFTRLDVLWNYNYKAMAEGKLGYHAKLKSGLCSDGFVNVKQVLETGNWSEIFAKQMVLKIKEHFRPFDPFKSVDYVIGVPSAATRLGIEIAGIVNKKTALLEKNEEGEMELKENIIQGSKILLVEDVSTTGLGFKEAIEAIKKKKNDMSVFPLYPVIVSRGGLESVSANGKEYYLFSFINIKMLDWQPKDCPLCKRGSTPIKPKKNEENWRLINTSQL